MGTVEVARALGLLPGGGGGRSCSGWRAAVPVTIPRDPVSQEPMSSPVPGVKVVLVRGAGQEGRCADSSRGGREEQGGGSSPGARAVTKRTPAPLPGVEMGALRTEGLRPPSGLVVSLGLSPRPLDSGPTSFGVTPVASTAHGAAVWPCALRAQAFGARGAPETVHDLPALCAFSFCLHFQRRDPKVTDPAALSQCIAVMGNLSANADTRRQMSASEDFGGACLDLLVF